MKFQVYLVDQSTWQAATRAIIRLSQNETSCVRLRARVILRSRSKASLIGKIDWQNEANRR